MDSVTEVCLYGSLRKELSEVQDFSVCFKLEAKRPLVEILEELAIPLERIQMVMVNHKAVTKDMVICPGDRVSLFPKEYPVFVDWKDYRF